MDPLQQDQEDFAARLSADSYFADISVLLQRRGVTESDIETALSVLNEKLGKIGAVVIVLKPALLSTDPDAPGPEYKVSLTVQVITQPLFNDDASTGTQKSTEAIAERVRLLLHRFTTLGGIYSFVAMQAETVAEGKDSFSVTFTRRACDTAERCGLPLITPDEGAGSQEVTLSTATAGAAIYYTLDGSYPSSVNEEATLYTAPFAPGTATLRCAAEKSGLQQSGVSQATFT